MKRTPTLYSHPSHLLAAASGAFTLVEMLLVLVILATLAAIVIPKMAGRSQQAKVTAAATQIENIGMALDTFEMDNGYYPKSGNLNDLLEQPANARTGKGRTSQGRAARPLGQRLHLRISGQASRQRLRPVLARSRRPHRAPTTT